MHAQVNYNDTPMESQSTRTRTSGVVKANWTFFAFFVFIVCKKPKEYLPYHRPWVTHRVWSLFARDVLAMDEHCKMIIERTDCVTETIRPSCVVLAWNRTQTIQLFQLSPSSYMAHTSCTTATQWTWVFRWYLTMPSLKHYILPKRKMWTKYY